METFQAPIRDIANGIPTHVLLFETGLVKSKGDAKRLVQNRGALLIGTSRKTIELETVVTANDLMMFWNEPSIVLSVGKGRVAVRVVTDW